MPKYIVLILSLFLLCLNSQAQGHRYSSRATHEAAAAPQLEKLARLEAEKEAELISYLDRYQTLSTDSQLAAKAQIREVLYEIFDLSMEQKEQEANHLRGQLTRLKDDPSHRHQEAEIQQLEQSLQKIESGLEFRRENRERIVAQRLSEIL